MIFKKIIIIIIIIIIIALMNQTMFLKFMLFNQSRHVSDEPSSIFSWYKIMVIK